MRMIMDSFKWTIDKLFCHALQRVDGGLTLNLIRDFSPASGKLIASRYMLH